MSLLDLYRRKKKLTEEEIIKRNKEKLKEKISNMNETDEFYEFYVNLYNNYEKLYKSEKNDNIKKIGGFGL